MALPVNVHVELDAVRFSLGGKDVGQSHGDRTKVDLGEVERLQWTRKHGLEHGFGDLLGHLAAGSVDVGP